MAGKKGYSGPPGNANAFRHGLAAVQRRRSEGALTPDEQDIRADILAGLIADKGGDQQIGTAERILAEIISSDVALLVTFNQAIAYLRFTAAVGNQASENLSPDVPLVFHKCTRARRLCTAARSCLKAFWLPGGPICRVIQPLAHGRKLFLC